MPYQPLTKKMKPLVKFQLIEYLRVFLNSRITLDNINGNLIISGAFGLYSKQAVVNVGGYTNGLMGEDMEIIVKIHSFYQKNNLEYAHLMHQMLFVTQKFLRKSKF